MITLDIVPEEGKQAQAVLGSTIVSLVEADGHYTGSFNMPNASATLTIETAYSPSSAGGGDLDKE